jgi:transposase
LQRQYKNHLSNFKEWNQKNHANKWLLFPENIGEYLSLDETEMSNGELYTILTNKSAKGKEGAIVAMIAGTKSEVIISIINKIPISKREQVREVTVDMANNMNLVIKHCFHKADIVIDRFHVQKLAGEAVQDIRIKYRWEAIDKENLEIEKSKKENSMYKPIILSNGDTIKQLLARSRHLLFKPEIRWTNSQKQRSKILFEHYPKIEQAYRLSQKLSHIYDTNTHKSTAMTKLAQWYKDVEESNFKAFNTVARSFYLHYDKILNYFNNRSTNASAESFNAKIKRFRAEFRGVKDLSFFLFRLTNIFA